MNFVLSYDMATHRELTCGQTVIVLNRFLARELAYSKTNHHKNLNYEFITAW